MKHIQFKSRTFLVLFSIFMFSILFWVGCDQQTTKYPEAPEHLAPDVAPHVEVGGEEEARDYFEQVINSTEFFNYMDALISHTESQVATFTFEDIEAEAELLSQSVLADPAILSTSTALNEEFILLSAYNDAYPELFEQELLSSESGMANIEILVSGYSPESDCKGPPSCETTYLLCKYGATAAYTAAIAACLAIPNPLWMIMCADGVTGVYLGAVMICRINFEECCKGTVVGTPPPID